ncbi:MAG: helix-turn-helix transcriptional regulator [Paludibacteraceae bacterium]|nr:helix-turn-helix transcriptional regulator [Paludibacteraceae bacterium]
MKLLRELREMDERERLAKIIESENLTAKQFATEIGVSAGTISNILGGRNKASADIYVRILNRFRTISSDWLMLGTGSMYRPNGGVTQSTLFGDLRPLDTEQTVEDNSRPAVEPSATPKPAPQTAAKQIARIIIYYTDGTYEER